jgi:hypothetical protein
LPVPHSWHKLAANAGLRASTQQKIALSRSSSQHGNKVDASVVGATVVGELVGAEVGASVGQSVPRLVSTVPEDHPVVPTEPTLTRGPHIPALP